MNQPKYFPVYYKVHDAIKNGENSNDPEISKIFNEYRLTTILNIISNSKDIKSFSFITNVSEAKHLIDKIKNSKFPQNNRLKELISKQIDLTSPLGKGLLYQFNKKFDIRSFPIIERSIFKNFTVEQSIDFLLTLENDKNNVSIDLMREVIAQSAQKKLKVNKKSSSNNPPTDITFHPGNTIGQKKSKNNKKYSLNDPSSHTVSHPENITDKKNLKNYKKIKWSELLSYFNINKKNSNNKIANQTELYPGKKTSLKNSKNNEGGNVSRLLSSLKFSKKNSTKDQQAIMQGGPPFVGTTTPGNRTAILAALPTLLVAPSGGGPRTLFSRNS